MQWQNETEECPRTNVTKSPAPLSKDSAHAVLLAGTGNSTGFLISPLPFAILLKLVVSLLGWIETVSCLAHAGLELITCRR